MEHIDSARLAALFDVCGFVAGTYTVLGTQTAVRLNLGVAHLPLIMAKHVVEAMKAQGVEQPAFTKHNQATFRVVLGRPQDQVLFLQAITPFLIYRKRAAENVLRLRDQTDQLSPNDKALLLDEALWFNTKEAWASEESKPPCLP